MQSSGVGAVGYFAVRLLVEVLDIPEAIVSAFVMILCFMGVLSMPLAGALRIRLRGAPIEAKTSP